MNLKWYLAMMIRLFIGVQHSTQSTFSLAPLCWKSMFFLEMTISCQVCVLSLSNRVQNLHLLVLSSFCPKLASIPYTEYSFSAIFSTSFGGYPTTAAMYKLPFWLLPISIVLLSFHVMKSSSGTFQIT